MNLEEGGTIHPNNGKSLKYLGKSNFRIIQFPFYKYHSGRQEEHESNGICISELLLCHKQQYNSSGIQQQTFIFQTSAQFKSLEVD